jgi:hypothetical protein
MNLLRRLFAIPPEPRSALRIILWWELRRPAYWCFLAVVGMGGALLMCYATRNPSPDEEGFELFLPMLLVILGSNICYTGGWVAELVARKLWKAKVAFFGPVAFSLGLIFSALVCLGFPFIFALCSL